MTDNFLEAVEENLRSDRYRTLFRKYAPWVVGVIVVALAAAVGFWAFDSWRDSQAEKASVTYNEALKTAQKGDSAAAFLKFGEVASFHAPAYKALALMGQGAIRLDENKTAEAVVFFDKAAKAAPDPVLQDAARLKSALALMDSSTFATIEERLKPLQEDKRPFRMAAREALAMAKLQAGRASEARDDFAVLKLAPGVPDSMRQRADAAMALIDSGSAAGLPAAVKAIQAAPPRPSTPTPLPQGPGAQAPSSGAAQ